MRRLPWMSLVPRIMLLPCMLLSGLVGPARGQITSPWSRLTPDRVAPEPRICPAAAHSPRADRLIAPGSRPRSAATTCLTPLWTRFEDGPPQGVDDQASALTVDGDGSVYVTGTSGLIPDLD